MLLALTLPFVQVVKRYIKREFSSRIHWNPTFWTKRRFPWICFGQTLYWFYPRFFEPSILNSRYFELILFRFKNLHSVSRPLKIQEPTKTGFSNQNSLFRQICFGQTFYPRVFEPSNRNSRYFEQIYFFSFQKLTCDFSNFENSGTKRKKKQFLGTCTPG